VQALICKSCCFHTTYKHALLLSTETSRKPSWRPDGTTIHIKLAIISVGASD